MNPNDPIDQRLMWVAKEGLLEPVPAPWQQLLQPNDEIIYYNTVTKERITEHPMDQKYKLMYKQEREKLTQEFESQVIKSTSKK